MPFIKHFHSLNILLTRVHENKYCYLTLRTEVCLAFLIFFCLELVDRSLPVLKVYWILLKLSRSSELKNCICFLPPVLARGNSLHDCTNQKSNSQSWGDPRWLVLFTDNIINRRQKNIIQKDRERKNNWMSMMSKVWQGLWSSKDGNKKFTAQTETLIMLNPKKYTSLTLNSIKYCPEMHLLFNPICNSIILVKKNKH